MREFGLGLREEIVVAFPAQRRASLNDQILIIAGVRFVTGHAIPVTDGLMHIFLFREALMALHAGFLRRFFQKSFEVRGVRRVAIKAITGFNRLMLKLDGSQRIIVTR